MKMKLTASAINALRQEAKVNHLAIVEAGNSSIADFMAVLTEEEITASESQTYSSIGGLSGGGAISVIPVKGSLYNNLDWACDWFTGYQFIENEIRSALADDSISSIALDIDSPGGMLSGCPQLADYISEAKAVKPIHAIIRSTGCSAAYYLASACDTVYANRHAVTASIGVIAVHYEVTKANEEYGLSATVFRSPERKAEGNPNEKLKPDVAERIQEKINASATKFMQHVAKSRNIDESVVSGLKGESIDADRALELGLIDEIATFDDALSELLTHGSSSNSKNKDGVMDVKEMIANQKAILALAEAKASPNLAQALAFMEGMTAESAKEILAAASADLSSVAEANKKKEQEADQADASQVSTQDQIDAAVKVAVQAALAENASTVASAILKETGAADVSAEAEPNKADAEAKAGVDLYNQYLRG